MQESLQLAYPACGYCRRAVLCCCIPLHVCKAISAGASVLAHSNAACLGFHDDPKLKVAIVGSGLAGLSTAVELLDQDYEVDIYEQRPFIGGKVASYRDKDGNHIEMG